MHELDRTLARLAHAPVPAALDTIDARVLARIASRPAVRQAGLGIGVLTTLAALAIGMVGADLSVVASAAPTLAPLGGSSPLAPSTLLVGEP